MGNKTIWTVALCAIVAFAAGWLGGRSSSTPPLQPVIASEMLATPQSSATSADMERVLAELLVEMRGLRADLRGASDNRSTREPATTAKETAPADLLAAIKELTNALREQPVRGERAGTGLGVRVTPTATGFASLDELFKSDSNSDLARLHRFWTLQDLIDRYGEPQYLRPEANGVLYARYTKRDANRESFHEFALYSGQVVYVMSNN